MYSSVEVIYIKEQAKLWGPPQKTCEIKGGDQEIASKMMLIPIILMTIVCVIIKNDKDPFFCGYFSWGGEWADPYSLLMYPCINFVYWISFFFTTGGAFNLLKWGVIVRFVKILI